MNIKQIKIQNFKGFEEKHFNFNSHMTVLIGDNATGKTTILDALSFLLGTFFLGVDGIPSRSLQPSEKRKVIVSSESFETKLPFKISVEHTLLGENYSWYRDTNKKKGGATSYKEARKLINKAEELVKYVSNGKPVSLPLIAYYGTERLSERHEKLAYVKESSRLDGYKQALDPSSFHRKFLEWFKTFEDSKLKFYKDDSLYQAFTSAITSMVSDWNKIHFSWEADDMLGQLDNGEWMALSMLSDGYKNIVRLSADIAYRAIKLNPHLGINAVKETEGVEIIAKNMGVNRPDVSICYEEMKQAAKTYLQLLDEAESSPEEKQEQYKQDLAKLIAPYAENPAYQAFLELKYETKLGE